MEKNNEMLEMRGHGNGPIDAFFHALENAEYISEGIKLSSYSEHALSEGADSKAVAYIQIERNDGVSCFGVGIDPSINGASLKALLCALNRMDKLKK